MRDLLGKYHFKGTFREYQQTILDNAAKHMKDRRLHIVAAPGSGKTILGLELICKYCSPAIVFAPTTTIRNQWGDRFAQNFLPDPSEAKDLVSFQLTNIKPLTCVTYQALHAAMNRLESCRLQDEPGEDNDDPTDTEQPAEIVDFSNFDLLEQCNAKEVLTICLDEAHHLKRDWQKALELFLSKLSKDVRIIALTATPPYDSTPEEWNRYVDCCGEIDDEIFVPQLVKQRTLCPHQDYIYFCYPSKEERAQLVDHQKRSREALSAIGHCDSFVRFTQDVLRGMRRETDLTDFIYDHARKMALFLSLAVECEISVPPKAFSLLTGKKTPLPLRGEALDQAFSLFIEKSTELDPYRDEIKKLLSEYEMLEKRCVCLSMDDRTKRMLVSSYGKMNSIKEIAKSEYEDLGNGLQMLILTDYIRKNLTPLIGTDQTTSQIGTVSIFEELRRTMPYESGIGVLSGSLVILPKSTMEAATQLAASYNTQITFKPYPNTEHYEVTIGGGNKTKVKLVSQLFAEGHLHILIGTKSLLGEGWDSPCINSLILASFVGSFVLSNQMRGRAIRMDQNHPEKVANIWHLVTVEPPTFFATNPLDKAGKIIFGASQELISTDYEMLKRRFNCFMGPAYSGDVIENGVHRIDIIKPPFDEAGIEKINQTMLAYAKNRSGVAATWENITTTKDCKVVESVETPKDFLPQPIRFVNYLAIFFFFSLTMFTARIWILSIIKIWQVDGFKAILSMLGVSVIFLALIVILLMQLPRHLRHSSSKNYLQAFAEATLRTLRDTQRIEPGGKVVVDADELGMVQISASNLSLRDQRIYAEAMEEILTPIKEPRYIVVQNGIVRRYRPFFSFACPTVIAKKQEWAQYFRRALSHYNEKFDVVYTRSESGRKLLFLCRRRSFVTINDQVARHMERIR
ncbi:MAG: DEAD/DEAH box helicase family protein [Lachnospiraceae bacterium]|jgi:superfamily II DNA or RNA helicase|nr:DEAD/DEAH box helicase family protein [Lachnospiraceae bacterium]